MAKAQNPERWAGETRDWSLPDLVMLNPNRKNRGSIQVASNDNDVTLWLRTETEMAEQERLDGASDGSRQTANVVR